MKNIKIVYCIMMLMLASFWLLSDTLLPLPLTYFSFRSAFIQFTGTVAIGFMSAGVLLAFRPHCLEQRLGGLDKMYRLHKWLGVSALILFVSHWWFAQGTKWMVGWGWLVRPARGVKVEKSYSGFIETFLSHQKEWAENVGLWVIYIAAMLVLLALIKRFPYHWFVKTHKWLAVAYLALVYHTAALFKFSLWTSPIGCLVAGLLLAGSVAAILILAGRVGFKRKVKGSIETLQYYPELRVIETSIALQPGWQGHRAGQFAFVTSDPKEGAHPYTITSAWNPTSQRIRFITKALGDHTSRLQQFLKVNMTVIVEGPYGCFTFDDSNPQQIWVGAGIGITPFIARMQELALIPGEKLIHLFHTTADYEQAALCKLTADAKSAGVKLHIILDSRDGLLDGAQIRAAVPSWPSASFWFCGPSSFGQALRKDLLQHGLSSDDFHQELFELR